MADSFDFPSRTAPQAGGLHPRCPPPDPTSHRWRLATPSDIGNFPALCLELADLSSSHVERTIEAEDVHAAASILDAGLSFSIPSRPWSSTVACFSISPRPGPSAASPLSARRCLLPASYHSPASSASRTPMLPSKIFSTPTSSSSETSSKTMWPACLG